MKKELKTEKELTQKTKPRKEEKNLSPGSEKLETKGMGSPPFPPPEPGEDISTGSQTPEEMEESEERAFEALDIEDFCKDVTGAIVDMIRIFVPKLTPLDAKQKKLIGKPLSKVVVDHNLDKLCKNEFLLIGAVMYVGYVKVQEMKKVPAAEKI